MEGEKKTMRDIEVCEGCYLTAMMESRVMTGATRRITREEQEVNMSE